MPGVKANTQAKGKEKEKVGGGGAAGIKARLGGGETRDCAMCVGTNPPARNRRGGGDATASTARWRLTSPPRRYVRAWRSTRVHPSPPTYSCKVKFNIRTPKAQLQEVGCARALPAALAARPRVSSAVPRAASRATAVPHLTRPAPRSTWTASTPSWPSRPASQATRRERACSARPRGARRGNLTRSRRFTGCDWQAHRDFFVSTADQLRPQLQSDLVTSSASYSLTDRS